MSRAPGSALYANNLIACVPGDDAMHDLEDYVNFLASRHNSAQGANSPSIV